MDKAYLKVTIERDYGTAGKLTIEASSGIGVDVNKPLVDFDQLVTAVNVCFDHYQSTHAVKMRTGQLSVDRDTIVVQGEGISVTMKNGKRMYAVKCGQWREHGVPFYPEHMIKCGINPKDIPDEGYKFKAEREVVVELENGKAKRVLEIRRG